VAPDYRFENDLSLAATIPAAWYRDPAVLQIEHDRVFARTWQLVGHADQVRLPGDYFTCTVADEPIVVCRGEDGAVRAFSSVCRHRGGPVAQGVGHRKSLQCAYHGWTYALDGRLLTTPEFDGVQRFDKAQVCLPQFRTESWGPFVFVNLDPAAPALADIVGSLPEETRRLPLDHMSLYKRVDYEVGCNWKVYVDNFLEGYHLPHVHPGLSKVLDYRAYDTQLFPWYSLQSSPLRDTAGIYGDGEAFYYHVYPNIMLNVMPGRLQTNRVLPLGPGRCRVEFDYYYAQDPKAQARIAMDAMFSDEIQHEDVAICEAVQKGLASGFYEAGRLCPKRESGVWHFHNMLRAAYGSAV